MKLEERKRLEDKISQILGDLTKGEKALLYKTLYAQGIKLADCGALMRQELAPASATAHNHSVGRVVRQFYLPRGLPSLGIS